MIILTWLTIKDESEIGLSFNLSSCVAVVVVVN